MIKNIQDLQNAVVILTALRVRENIFFCTKEQYDNLIFEVSDRGKNSQIFGIMKELEPKKIPIIGTLMYCGINFIFIELSN